MTSITNSIPPFIPNPYQTSGNDDETGTPTKTENHPPVGTPENPDVVIVIGQRPEKTLALSAKRLL